MPVFHFNIFEADHAFPDHDGSELDNLDAARVEALSLAGEMIKDSRQRLARGGDWRLEITDDRGLILIRMHFITTEAPTSIPFVAPVV